MPQRSLPQRAALALGLLAAGPAFAHDGHGLAGAHWHATDTFGLLLVGALGALAWWLSRR
jgi:hypothetical protein